jgi:membrane-bound lytic murein transglycosylase D
MKASGIWQFMPSTGKVYGLQQNAWYDGRRDILQATNAALDYLQNLHGMFGDWELALAAYNCGEGCVARAQTRAPAAAMPPSSCPNETRNYVPKLLRCATSSRTRNASASSWTRSPDEAVFSAGQV